MTAALAKERGQEETVGPLQKGAWASTHSLNEIPKHEPTAITNNVKDYWAIDAAQVQIMQNISDCRTSATFLGNWRGKTVLVKVPKVGVNVTEADISRIRSEINSIKKMNHANLLPILAACLTPPDLCYLVDFASDGNLSTILFNPAIELSANQSLKLAFDTASGLVALHESKPYICHGNLKSTNIMVNMLLSKIFGDQAKLAHYGFKHSLFQQQVAQPYALYKPQWLAPEIIKGTDYDERSADVFAFGLVLFEIITRQEIFHKFPPLILGIKISKGLLPKIPDYVPEDLVCCN